MIFYALTSAGPRGRCWNPSLKGEVLKPKVLKPKPERRGVETRAWKVRCWNPRCWNPSLKGEVLKPEPERWGVETQGVETQAWKARCWNPRCWNPSLKGEGFNTSRGAQQMLMYQKSMFDRYYCIQTFCRSKTLEKLLRIYFFPVPIMVW